MRRYLKAQEISGTQITFSGFFPYVKRFPPKQPTPGGFPLLVLGAQVRLCLFGSLLFCLAFLVWGKIANVLKPQFLRWRTIYLISLL